MPFKNRRAATRITKKPCELCGTTHVKRHASHIVDEIKGSGGAGGGDWNALSLCPNCHSVFEDQFRPKLHRALVAAGCTKLPRSWAMSNKHREKTKE
jgi:hypothetical protein